jgi:outer membrane protein assembly factor BamB
MQAEIPAGSPCCLQIPSLSLLSSPYLFLCILAIVFAGGSPQLNGQGLGDWPEFHNTNMERSNPYETVLGINNVGSLSLRWSYNDQGGLLAVANGVVYFGSGQFSVYALDTGTGAKLWSYSIGDSVQSSPAVANGVVYVGSDDNNVYALNATTGAKLWSYTTGYAVQSSPTVTNGAVYVGSADNNVYALNATTGAKLWSYTTGGYVQASPTVANSVVYVGRMTATYTR